MKELHNLPAQALPLHQFPNSGTSFHGASAERVGDTASTPGDSSPPLLSSFPDSARIKGGRLGLPRSTSSTPAISSLSAESASCPYWSKPRGQATGPTASQPVWLRAGQQRHTMHTATIRCRDQLPGKGLARLSLQRLTMKQAETASSCSRSQLPLRRVFGT